MDCAYHFSGKNINKLIEYYKKKKKMILHILGFHVFIINWVSLLGLCSPLAQVIWFFLTKKLWHSIFKPTNNIHTMELLRPQIAYTKRRLKRYEFCLINNYLIVKS